MKRRSTIKRNNIFSSVVAVVGIAIFTLWLMAYGAYGAEALTLEKAIRLSRKANPLIPAAEVRVHHNDQ